MTVKIVHVDGSAPAVAQWHQLCVAGADVRAVYVDTGNAHPQTPEYLNYLENRIGQIERIHQDFADELAKKRERIAKRWAQLHIPSERIQNAMEALAPTGIPFLDLCLVVGRFPGWDSAFCEPELVYRPLREQIVQPLLDAGGAVVRYVDSIHLDGAVAAALPGERIATLPAKDDAREYLAANSLNEHPSYFNDAEPRCAMCFKDSKLEIRHIAQAWPEIVQSIGEWEQRVSRVVLASEASYFHSGRVPPTYGDRRRVIPITEVAIWAMTTGGGRNNDWVEMLKANRI